jgi:membrane-bound serine protease (ClpP class)
VKTEEKNGSWATLLGAVLILCGAFLIGCAPQPASLAQPQAYVLLLDGPIGQAWQAKVRRELDAAIQKGVGVFILELETGGGTIAHSKGIGNMLFKRDEIKTVAYIHSMAYSGGTMIALACDELFADRRTAQMGDVAPVDQDGKMLNEKVQSPVRALLRTYADGRYPEALIEAMVTPEVEVWKLEPHATGSPDAPEADSTVAPAEVRYVTRQEYEMMEGDELRRYAKRRIVVPAGQLLTFGPREAREYGFATGVDSLDDVCAALKIDPKQVERRRLTPSERIIVKVDYFTPLLIAFGLILLFIEVSRAGFGLPGILSLACFALFFVIKLSLGYADGLEVLLFVVGLALLIVEILLIPGFGWAGASGIILLLASLVLAMLDFSTKPIDISGTMFVVNGVAKVLGACMVAVFAIALLARNVEHIPYFSRLVHDGDLGDARAAEIMEQHVPGLAEMAGRTGTALTTLRPAGRADFAGTPIDVVTNGDFIEKGACVRVLEVSGSRVVVEPVDG